MNTIDWSRALEQFDPEVPSDLELAELATATGETLGAARLISGTAESCTGGLVAKLITDIAGSSAWFDAGFVTYSNEAKHQMLGVPNALFSTDGAVSESVVLSLAEGVLQRSAAQISTSISGVAGPGGGTPDKPVGTVWIAWARSGQVSYALSYQFDGDRDAIRRLAARQALRGIILLASVV